MSIRPTIIDRNGSLPCLPQLALLGALRAAAEGRAPSLWARVVKCLGNICRRIFR